MAMYQESIRQKVTADLRMFARRESRVYNWKSIVGLFLFSPGFQFIFTRRIQEAAERLPFVGSSIRKIVWAISGVLFKSGIDVDAEIGGGFYIPHPYGISVARVIIGRDVTLLQNVTIGQSGCGKEENPVLEDGAYIAAGAVVTGKIKVGNSARVGANCVLLEDLPAGATAVAIPAIIYIRKIT
ncbi:serine O-acetyltransferase [Agrobacterium sp. NPDC090273]|uniref:serine O-acetyltransferase n=1 Tax=Agrobacterium sp. NPDC090273 TaxID=3363919 RepID=UPI00383A9D43